MEDNLVIKQIVKRVKSGDSEAFRVLVEKYQHLAFTIAISIVKNREDAEEVIQDSFIKVFKNIMQYKEEAKFSSWLFKIVYNTALSRIRKKVYNTISLDADEYEKDYGISTHNGWKELVVNDQKKYIQKALDNLNEQDKLVLTLYYLAEEGLNEICAITNENKSTVKARLHRARVKLYNQLERLLKDETRVLI